MESTIEKKKNYMRSSPIDLIGEAELHGNGRSQWQWSRQRKKKKERECVCKEKKKEVKIMEKLYSPHGGSRHLSSILVKDSYIFKIVVSVFSFYLKLHNFKQVRVFY